ncbi:hypothetical protein BD779DRAFT_1669082 [Infundibulicybe gibba]|nr:hypothetical protein BD779DRAFT_1669082 [Infundibulicybe gibba]
MSPTPFWTLVKASRLPAWIFGPTLFTIGVIHGRSIPKSASLAVCMILQTISFSFPLCIIVFGINDIYDYESDIRNPRKLVNGLEGGVLAPEDHKLVLLAAYGSTLFIILLAIINQHRYNIIAVVAMVTLGWQYSSPPLRLKEAPVLDSLSNGLIVFLAWLMLALCATGIHALGAATDADVDRIAGQRTIAVALGTRAATAFAALC